MLQQVGTPNSPFTSLGQGLGQGIAQSMAGLQATPVTVKTAIQAIHEGLEARLRSLQEVNKRLSSFHDRAVGNFKETDDKSGLAQAYGPPNLPSISAILDEMTKEIGHVFAKLNEIDKIA